MVTLLAAGLALVSCNNDKPVEKPVEPVFPEAVTKALEAGETYTLNIEPNVDWTIELKYDVDATGWFWIQDGNSKVYTVRGKAGDKAAIEVCAGEQTDFDKVRTCTLEMTMGEKTRTVATFTRGTVERTFTLAYCEVEADGSDFVYAEDTESGFQYQYGENLTGEKPAIPLEWIIRTKSFCRSILVSANFEWQLKSKPEWLGDLGVTGAEAGETVEFIIQGDPNRYPLEDAEGELVFCAASNREAAYVYTVQIPGCKDMFEISGFAADTHANKEGQIFEDNMMGEGSYADVEVGISGTVTGRDNVDIHVFSYVTDGQGSYWDNSEENISWINALLTAPDVATVLKDHTLNITVTPNSGKERKACVIAIPDDKAPADVWAFFPDGQNIDAQYEDYVVTVLTQEGTDSEEGGGNQPGGIDPITFVFESDYNYDITDDIATLEYLTEDNMAELMLKYKKYDRLNISDYLSTSTSATYILTYYSTSQSMTALKIPNYNPQDVLYEACHPANKKEWLSYEASENSLSIWMEKPAADASQNFGIIQIFITASRSYTIICLPELE